MRERLQQTGVRVAFSCRPLVWQPTAYAPCSGVFQVYSIHMRECLLFDRQMRQRLSDAGMRLCDMQNHPRCCPAVTQHSPVWQLLPHTVCHTPPCFFHLTPCFHFTKAVYNVQGQHVSMGQVSAVLLTGGTYATRSLHADFAWQLLHDDPSS